MRPQGEGRAGQTFPRDPPCGTRAGTPSPRACEKPARRGGRPAPRCAMAGARLPALSRGPRASRARAKWDSRRCHGAEGGSGRHGYSTMWSGSQTLILLKCQPSVLQVISRDGGSRPRPSGSPPRSAVSSVSEAALRPPSGPVALCLHFCVLISASRKKSDPKRPPCLFSP